MRTITETTDITRVEAADGQYMDFDMESYDVDRRISEWVEVQQEANRYPRVYRGTVVIELKEVKW